MKRIVALLALFGLVGVASAKEVYVSANNVVLGFDAPTHDPRGSLIGAGAGGLLRATGVVEGPDGDLYVASPVDDAIIVYDGRNGALIGTFLDENDRLRSPAGITFGPNGHLYVANRFRNEVVEYNLAGDIINIFTEETGIPLLTPEDVEFGSDGLLYVADANNNRIVRIDPIALTSTEFVSALVGQLDYPHGLAFDTTGNLYVASHFSDEVRAFNRDGIPLGVFANVVEPVGLTVDESNRVSVVSFGNSTLQLFASNGSQIATHTVPARASYAVLVDRPVLQSLSRTPTSVFGGCQDSSITATLDRPAPAGGAIVALTSSVASLTVPSSVTIPAGQTSVTFTATSSAVNAQVTAEIRGISFGVSRSTFVVVKPIGLATGTAALTLTPTTVNGGSSASGRVALFCPAQLGSITVTLASSSSAIASVPASVTIPVGQSFADFTITTTSPSTATTLVISATLDRTQSRNLVVNPSVRLSAVNLASTSFTGGTSTTGTVTLTGAAPAGGLSVALSSNIAQATVPATVLVPAGASSANFTLSSSVVTAATNGVVTASFGGTSVTRSFILRPIPVLTVALSPSTVTSNQTSTGTVTLELPAGPAGVVVTLTSQTPAVAAPTTSTVTVAPGASSATFVVQAQAVTSRQTARIVAQAQGTTTTKFAIITVNP